MFLTYKSFFISLRSRKEFRRLKKDKPIYFTQSESEILTEFHTSPEGLSDEQAKKNLEKYGPNKLAEEKKKSLFAKFILSYSLCFYTIKID